MDNEKFGDFIATLRKNKGLTQKELALKLSVTDKAVSKWERGLSFPDITLINSLAEILEVDVSEILKGEFGKDKSIDVQKSVDEAIENINKKIKERNDKIKKNIVKGIIIVVLISLIIFIAVKNYIKYNPNKIVTGENNYKLERYCLEDSGLDKMKEIIEKSENMPSKYDISYFDARLDKERNSKTIYFITWCL